MCPTGSFFLGKIKKNSSSRLYCHFNTVMWQRILVENGFEDPSLHTNFRLVATCLWKCHLSFEAQFPQCKMSCSSVVKPCPTLCGPIDCSTSGFSVLHYLPEFAETHVPWVNDAIQTSPLLLPPSPHALDFPQHQRFFFFFFPQCVSSLHQVA